MRRLVDLHWPTQEDWLVLAQLAMTTGRTDEAMGDLARVGDRHPMSSQARLWEGQLALRRQRARAAELSFLRTLAIDPGSIPARRELVYLYGMQRRRRELATQFEALAELAPMTFDEVILWCLIRVSPWDPNEVRPILEAFLQSDPSDRASRLALAEVYRRLGLAEEVDVALRQLPPVDPDAARSGHVWRMTRATPKPSSRSLHPTTMATRSSRYFAVVSLSFVVTCLLPSVISALPRQRTHTTRSSCSCWAKPSSRPGTPPRGGFICSPRAITSSCTNSSSERRKGRGDTIWRF